METELNKDVFGIKESISNIIGTRKEDNAIKDKDIKYLYNTKNNNLKFESIDNLNKVLMKIQGRGKSRRLYKLLESKGIERSVIVKFMSCETISNKDYSNIYDIVLGNI